MKVPIFLSFFFCINSAFAMKEEENKALRAQLIARTKTSLYQLSSHFDHADLLEAAKPIAYGNSKIATVGASMVVALPALAHKIALNQDGSALAVAYANNLTLYQKRRNRDESICDLAFRFPVQGLAFLNRTHLNCTHSKARCSFDLTEKTFSAPPLKERAFVSTVSHNGKWLLEEAAMGITADYYCFLHNFETNYCIKPEISSKLTRFKACAVDSAGQNFILATASKIALLRHTMIDGQYKTQAWAPPSLCRNQITDIDITPDGSFGLIVGDGTLCAIKFLKENEETPNYITFDAIKNAQAARFIPSERSIILSQKGVVQIVDWDVDQRVCFYHKLFSLSDETIECLAVSADSRTIAAGGENGAYLVQCKDVEQSLTIEQLQLVRALKEGKPQEIIEMPEYKEIFKTIKDPRIKQRLIKLYSINYSELGYHECSVCKDNFADSPLACKHSFCFECLEKWKDEQEKKSCPLCRAALVSNDKS